MEKVIRQVRDDGTFQVTTVDERFYAVVEKDKETNLPMYDYYPSSSWVCGYYPKGKGFEAYLKQNGFDSDDILVSRGARGTKIHHACEKIILGEKLEIDTKVFDGVGESELTVDEWQAVKSFVDWNNEVKPKYILSEKTVISRKHRYGGTIDVLCEIGGETWLIDFKTAKEVYMSHIIQLSSYKHGLIEENPDGPKEIRLAILQLGYAKNKKHWKFTEVEDKFNLFLTVYKIWEAENPDSKPRQITLPTTLSIDNPLTQEHEDTPVPSIEIPGGEGPEGGGEPGRSSEPDGGAKASPRRRGHTRGEDSRKV